MKVAVWPQTFAIESGRNQSIDKETVLAGVHFYPRESREDVDLAAVPARRLGTLQPEQLREDREVNRADDRPAFILELDAETGPEANAEGMGAKARPGAYSRCDPH